MKRLKIRNVQDTAVLPQTIHELLASPRKPENETAFRYPQRDPSKPCSEKSESCAAVCTDTHQECIIPCSVKASCWYCTYSGTGEQEGIITVQAVAIQKILMTGARERHDGTGVFQGTDIEMHCPHVITDQILVACKKKVT